MLTQARPWLPWQLDRYILAWLLSPCITGVTVTTRWSKLTQIATCPISVNRCMVSQWRTCNQGTITSLTCKVWKQSSHMLSWRALSKRTLAPCPEILSNHKHAHVNELLMLKEVVAKLMWIRLRGELQHTLAVLMINNREIKVARRV